MAKWSRESWLKRLPGDFEVRRRENQAEPAHQVKPDGLEACIVRGATLDECARGSKVLAQQLGMLLSSMAEDNAHSAHGRLLATTPWFP